MTRPLSYACLFAMFASSAYANPPVASYIYPAGGQRGTTVPVRVGGLFLSDKCSFALDGQGLIASKQLVRAKPLWFEGPLLPLPDSQQQEDYPADMTGSVSIAKDAAIGPRRGWVFTSQGGAGGLAFVVGSLPEAVEREVDGDPIAHAVALPITANGRIFPRDNVDLWEFEANAGQTMTALAVAKSLHSPLAAKLEILDPSGRVLAENMIHALPASDESVRFTAPAKAKYRIRIGDAKGQGGPSYVYRLTITTEVVPELAFPLKTPADGLPDLFDVSKVVAAPVALNGRIAKAGAIQEWKVELKKAAKYSFDLQARRFDSPLCGIVTIHDSTAKEVARGEASDPALDPSFAFQPPADGIFTLRVAERFRTRGGPNFVYRLRISDGTGEKPGFKLTVPFDARQQLGPAPDAITLLRGTPTKVKVNVDRTGSFAGTVELSIASLPKGVTCKPAIVAANQTTAELTLEADKSATIATVPLTIVGAASGGPALSAVAGLRIPEPKALRVPAVLAGDRFMGETTSLFLTIGIPTPFKLVDEYVMTSAPRGETYRRKYRLERDPGFTGPVAVSLADRQARHLQGVNGPLMIVPSGQTEVEYPASLPPWMELGRTCRVCVMAVGTVKDADGTEHAVTFSSVGQNQQMIVVIGPGRLDVQLEKLTVRAEPGTEVRVPVKVIRARELTGPVKVEVAIPEHWKGVSVSPITISADKQTSEIVLKFAAGECGPFNMPLVVRATLETKATSIFAEAKLEVVK